MARRPSLASALWRARSALASRSAWSTDGRADTARCTTCFIPASASGALSAMLRARLSAAVSTSAAAGTWCTMPISYARRASMSRPVNSSCRVCAGPMISTSFWPSGNGTIRPMRASGMPMRAVSAITRRSQCSASSHPPAMASPCTRAMVGWRERSTRCSTPTTSPSGSRAPPRDSMSLRSMPEQNALPAPRTTTTRTSRRVSRSSKAERRPVSIAVFMALRWSGRFSVTVAMPSATPVRISSDMARMVSSRPMPSFSGFTLPDELRVIREQVRRFIREEIIPLEQRLDPDAPGIPDADFKRLSEKTRAAGLWALAAPEEYGGGGMDTFAMSVILEEMAQHRMGLYNIGCGVFGRYPPPAIWAGTKTQIEKYAAPTIREGWRTFFAITEPSGGSDPAGAIQTRAEKRGDKWVLNGRKVFISNIHNAKWGVVWARTDKAKGRAGISCFIVEPGTPGFTWKNIRTIRTAAIPNDVVFEECVLPGDALIRQEGQGLDLAFDLLVKNRFTYSATNLGVAVAAHRMAIAHAKQRSTFGQLLSQRKAIQWMLADAEVEIRAC